MQCVHQHARDHLYLHRTNHVYCTESWVTALFLASVTKRVLGFVPSSFQVVAIAVRLYIITKTYHIDLPPLDQRHLVHRARVREDTGTKVWSVSGTTREINLFCVVLLGSAEANRQVRTSQRQREPKSKGQRNLANRLHDPRRVSTTAPGGSSETRVGVE